MDRAVKTELKRRRKANQATGERRRRLRNFYFGSFEARLAAVNEANQSFPANHRLSLKVLVEIARGLDPVRGTDEPAIVRTKRKSQGDGFRVVTRFDIWAHRFSARWGSRS